MIVVRVLSVLGISTGRRRVSVLRVGDATGGDGRGPGAEWNLYYSRSEGAALSKECRRERAGHIDRGCRHAFLSSTAITRMRPAFAGCVESMRAVYQAVRGFCTLVSSLPLLIVITLIETVDRITLFYSTFSLPFWFRFLRNTEA
jgi:hypothetical protein